MRTEGGEGHWGSASAAVPRDAAPVHRLPTRKAEDMGQVVLVVLVFDETHAPLHRVPPCAICQALGPSRDREGVRKTKHSEFWRGGGGVTVWPMGAPAGERAHGIVLSPCFPPTPWDPLVLRCVNALPSFAAI